MQTTRKLPVAVNDMSEANIDNNGDCRQEIVLIGRNMDREALTAMFESCLLTRAELESDAVLWPERFPDPFPKWEMGVKAF